MLAVSLILCCLLLWAGASPSTRQLLDLAHPVSFDAASTCDYNRNGSNVDVFKTYTITAPDGSMNASFISLGAAITDLYVKGRDGAFRDVVLGYDNRTQYLDDSNYGKRTSALTGHVDDADPSSDLQLTSDRLWADTRIGSETVNKLPFADDAVLRGGHPADNHVTYTLHNNAKWTTNIDAEAYEPTPLLLSSHVYWNLDAYQDAQTILNHTLYLQSKKYIKGDGIEIPTGEIVDIVRGSALDFSTPRQIGSKLNDTIGVCGTGCIGIDTAFIYDEANTDPTVMELSSALSGIKLSVRTNQLAGQVYTCSGQTGKIPRKASQGGPSTAYDQLSCIVLEQEGWIGGINQPQWGQNQIYGTPGRENYNWWSEYKFSIF